MMSRQGLDINSKINNTRSFLGEDLFDCDECRRRAKQPGSGDDALDNFRYYTLLRARSLAKACYLRIQYEDGSQVQLLESKRRLEKLFNDFGLLLEQNTDLSDSDITAALLNYVHDLVDLIKPNCPKARRKAELKGLGQAEVYSITFHNNRASTQVLVDDGIYRIETANNACASVRNQYNAVSDNNAPKPKWYRKMPAWERLFIMQAVRRSNELTQHPPTDRNDINYITRDFFTMKTPAGGSRPGGSNFGRDVFTVGRQESVFYYLSTPSKFSQVEATAVLQDFFANYLDQMIADFKRCYSIQGSTGADYTIPVLLESLLTPVWYDKVAQAMMSNFSDNNSRMVKFKHQAIVALREYLGHRAQPHTDGNNYHFSLIENNQPLNGRRVHMRNSEQPRLQAGLEIIRQSLNAIRRYGDMTALNPAAQAALTRISEIFANPDVSLQQIITDHARELSTLLERDLSMQVNFGRYSLYIDTLAAYVEAWRRGKTDPDSENHALYLASCETILMQEAGGVTQINCKSSKDRAGLLKATNTFHRLHFQRYGQLPRYGSQFSDFDRRNLFLECVRNIPGQIGHRVSPGCCGIKDEPFMETAMTPTFATRDKQFKLNKALAKNNHIKEAPVKAGSTLAAKIDAIKNPPAPAPQDAQVPDQQPAAAQQPAQPVVDPQNILAPAQQPAAAPQVASAPLTRTEHIDQREAARKQREREKQALLHRHKNERAAERGKHRQEQVQLEQQQKNSPVSRIEYRRKQRKLRKEQQKECKDSRNKRTQELRQLDQRHEEERQAQLTHVQRREAARRHEAEQQRLRQQQAQPVADQQPDGEMPEIPVRRRRQQQPDNAQPVVDPQNILAPAQQQQAEDPGAAEAGQPAPAQQDVQALDQQPAAAPQDAPAAAQEPAVAPEAAAAEQQLVDQHEVEQEEREHEMQELLARHRVERRTEREAFRAQRTQLKEQLQRSQVSRVQYNQQLTQLSAEHEERLRELERQQVAELDALEQGFEGGHQAPDQQPAVAPEAAAAGQPAPDPQGAPAPDQRRTIMQQLAQQAAQVVQQRQQSANPQPAADPQIPVGQRHRPQPQPPAQVDLDNGLVDPDDVAPVVRQRRPRHQENAGGEQDLRRVPTGQEREDIFRARAERRNLRRAKRSGHQPQRTLAPQPGERETVAAAVTRYVNSQNMPNDVIGYFQGADQCLVTLYQEIYESKKQKAEECGIVHRVVENSRQPIDGYPQYTLIRDARNIDPVKANSESVSRFNYDQIAKTYCMAAITIFDLDELSRLCSEKTGRVVIDADNFRVAVYQAAQQFSQQVLTLHTEAEQEKALDAFIIKGLAPMIEEASGHQINTEKAIRLLSHTKDWVAMYQPTLAVATIDNIQDTNGNDISVVRAEEPLTILTPELIAEYDNRNTKEWYLSQSGRIRKLIDHFVPYIKRGHQIPSQLRRFLPGLKNGYRSTTSAVMLDPTSNSSFLQKLSDSHHCASIVPVIMPDHDFLKNNQNSSNPFAGMSKNEIDSRMREERIRLTQLGLLQQRVITGSQTNTMVALNSILADDFLLMADFFKGTKTEALDKEMALLTLEAASRMPRTGAAKVCLNEFRLLEPNQDGAIKHFRKVVKSFLRDYRGQAALLRVDKRLITAMEESLQRLKKRYSTTRLRRFFNKLDKESIGAKLVQEFTLLSDLFNRVLAQIPKENHLSSYASHVAFYACASGENRTGIIEFASQIGALEYNLPIFTGTSIDVRAAITRLADSGHVQAMTGSQGSILGTESIRDKSLGSLLKKMKFADKTLSKPYAGYKSPSKKAVTTLLRGQNTSAIASHLQASKALFNLDGIFTPRNLMTMRRINAIKDSLSDLRDNQSTALGFVGTEVERLTVIAGLMDSCDDLLQPGMPDDVFSDSAKKLIKKLAAFSFNILNAAAWNDTVIPHYMKNVLKEVAELTSSPNLKAVADFDADDMKVIKSTLKRNRYFKIGAVAGLAFSSLFFPATALVATKFAGLKALAAVAGVSLKAKIATDIAVSSAAGLAARSSASTLGNQSARRTIGTLFNQASGTGAVETLGRVMDNMIQFSSILGKLKDAFGFSRKTPVFVTRSTPLASDMRQQTRSTTVDIVSERRPTGDNVMVEVDLHYSKNHDCKVLNKQLKKYAGSSETRPRNRVGLSFYRNNLQYIQLDRGGSFTPAKAVIEMLHEAGKKEVVLTGVLSERFVKEIRNEAARHSPPLRVKDNRGHDLSAGINGLPSRGMRRGA